jgi:hypothetical protein
VRPGGNGTIGWLRAGEEEECGVREAGWDSSLYLPRLYSVVRFGRTPRSVQQIATAYSAFLFGGKNLFQIIVAQYYSKFYMYKKLNL